MAKNLSDTALTCRQEKRRKKGVKRAQPLGYQDRSGHRDCVSA